MERIGWIAVAFAAGWLVRGKSESSRAATVTILAASMAAFDRVKRVVAIERDHLEDLVAEARARADVLRADRRATAGADDERRAAA